MKEMKYQSLPSFVILAHGTYKGFPYWAVSLGTHPTAYIDVTSIKDKLGDNPRIGCHGGITYDEDELQNVWNDAFVGFKKGERRFIGWDYAHAGDYMESPTGSAILMNGRQYTTEMVVTDIMETVDEIVNEY